MVDIHLQNLLWVYCPGHAGVKGNDRADRLAGKAALTSGWLLGRSEVLRSLRHYLRAQSQGHHIIDRQEERGVERGSARWSFLKGREAIVSQTNIGPVSKATLGKLPRDGSGAHMGFFRAHRYHLQLNWTELCHNVKNQPSIYLFVNAQKHMFWYLFIFRSMGTFLNRLWLSAEGPV